MPPEWDQSNRAGYDEAARERIHQYIHRTPVIPSPQSPRAEHPGRLPRPMLKLEHQQYTGSFKLRGATNAILEA